MHMFSPGLPPLLALLQSRQRPLFERSQNQDSDASAVAPPPWVPPMDVQEGTDCFVIRADLPGIDPAQIEVQVDGDTLSIKGKRTVETKDEDEQGGVRFSRIERQTGSFHRRFVLPDTVDAERITACGHNGVLVISIPKCQGNVPRRIEISVPPLAKAA